MIIILNFKILQIILVIIIYAMFEKTNIKKCNKDGIDYNDSLMFD